MAALSPHGDHFTKQQIQSFVGSSEEDNLKDLCKDLLQNDLLSFINLVMISCNSLNAPFFDKADVVLETYLQAASDSELERKKSRSIIKKVSLKTMFKSYLLDSVAKDGLKTVPEIYYDHFLVLLEFLKGIKYHQKCLHCIKTTNAPKSSVGAVMVKHLFSCLVPGHSYVLYNGYENKTGTCPCGCNSDLTLGNTSVGLNSTWHGFPDIYLNKKIPVSLFKNEDDDVSDDDEEDDYECLQEPKAKRTRKEERDLKIFEEVTKKDTNDRNILLLKHTVHQMVAETITNGFAQVNKDEALSGYFIPTIGCTTDHLMFYMYDPKNDILLQSSKLIPLWMCTTSGDCILRTISVVQIWLLLNSLSFGNPDFATRYDLRKSRFHTQPKDHLEKYSQLQCNGVLSFSDIEIYETTLDSICSFASEACENGYS